MLIDLCITKVMFEADESMNGCRTAEVFRWFRC